MGQFTKQEHKLFNDLEDLKSPIQANLDAFNAELKDENKTVKEIKEIRGKIFEEKKHLVLYSEMQAGLASVDSRDKYFPDLSRNAFMEQVIKTCG